MSKKRKIILSLFTFTVVASWVLGGYFFYLATHPVSEDDRLRHVEISPGMTLKQTSDILAEKHLIRSASTFRILAHLRDKHTQIQAGEYEISPAMVPGEILTKITSGKTVLHPVTIPEGFRITEIAAHLADRGLVDSDKFIEQTQNPRWLKEMDIPGDSLEGYLFPETYHFSKYTTEEQIIQKMLDTFRSEGAPEAFRQRARELKLSYHEIVTLASLIEKETGVDEERKIISSVFHNRLKKNMKLQTDPTVIYAIRNFDGNIRKKDLSIDSPYNTYRYFGLPPGPIASPGRQSIEAALYPNETEFLYFVSKKDGRHKFSSNLADHNAAVAKYQLGRIKKL